MFGLRRSYSRFACRFRQYPNVQEVRFLVRMKGIIETVLYRFGYKGDTTFGDLMDISCDIDDLGLLYKVDVLLYTQEKELLLVNR